jgi:hypothetical protein
VDLSYLPIFKNVKLGYTAIDGDKALIGFTGTVCVLELSPSCFTNNDPAAILNRQRQVVQRAAVAIAHVARQRLLAQHGDQDQRQLVRLHR